MNYLIRSLSRVAMMLSFRKGSEGERTAVIVGPNGEVDGEGDAVELKLNGNREP